MRHFRKILALLLVLATIASIVPWGISASAASDYVTVEEAALQIREYMKNRTENFDICIRSTEDYPWTSFNAAWAQAIEHTGNPTEGDYLAFQFGPNRQTYTSFQSGGMYYYTFTVTMSYRTTLEQERELDIAVDALLEQLDVWDKSDYEKIYAVYDYICQNVKYDYEHMYDEEYLLKGSAYAALINKTAVCQGYTVLLYRLLLELGIDNRIISGKAMGADHGWNIVELDGWYYNADATWDEVYAEYNQHPFFLKNTDDFGGRIRNSKYDTREFHLTYPIAPVSYGTDVEPLLTQLTPDVWYDNQYYYSFTPDITGEYSLFTYILSSDTSVVYDAQCYLYDSEWNPLDLVQSSSRRIQMKAHLEAGKTYYYALPSIAGTVPRVKVILKSGEEVPGTGRLENVTHANYAISDLVLGEDGIYRTPEGRNVYIAFDNVLDGGLTCLDGNTMYYYLNTSISNDYYGLHRLQDEYGYVILNEYTLSFLHGVISHKDSTPEFLFYDSSEESAQGARIIRILEPDTMTTVTALPDGEAVWYAYRPTQAGYYTLSAYSDGYDTYCQTDGEVWTDYPADDDSRGDRDFRVTLYMEAGAVYYFLVSCKDAPPDASFRIQLTAESQASMTTELFANTSITVSPADGMYTSYYSFTPTQSGHYKLYTFNKNGIIELAGTLYNANGEILDTSFPEADKMYSFSLESWMEAGETYYYELDNNNVQLDYQLILRNLDTPPTVQPLTLGVPNTVPISLPGTVGYGSFTPSESGMYTFQASSADTLLCLELTDSTGKLLAEQTEEDWSRAFSAELWLEAGETYSCAMWHYDYRDGSIEVLITRPDTEISVNPLYLNQPATAVIDHAGAYTYFQLEAPSNRSYALTVSPDAPVVYKVFNADWNILKTGTLHDGSQHTLALNVSGAYYIAFAYQDPRHTGSFPLMLTLDVPVLSLDTPAAVTVERAYTHYLYAYTPAVSGYYVLESDAKGARTSCILLDSSLRQIGSSSTGNGNDFRLWHWLESGQTYYYDVSYVMGGTGTFDICLSYKADDDGTNAKQYLVTDIPVNSSVSGYPFGTGFTEHWFIPRESGYYTLSSVNSDDFISCELFADDVPLAASSSDSMDFTLRAWLEAGKEYCYRIGKGGYGSASFQLLLTYEGSGAENPELPVLTLDTPVTAAIEASGTSVCYTFTPSASGFYTFTADSGGFDTCCYLYDSQWTQYQANNDAGSNRDFRLIAPLTAGETYYFEVRFYGADAERTGTVQLLLKESDGIVASGKVENSLGNLYSLTDLTLGKDGVYRTPEGCTVYIAVDNQSDGGLQWMNGKTLCDYVAYYGSQMFDITHWDALLALADRDGYVVLTETSLAYLVTTITGNPKWMESRDHVPNYLFYNLTPSTEENRLGDVNSDGNVDTLDAWLVMLHYAEQLTLTESQFSLADTDGNGRVDTADAYRILLLSNK